MIFVNIAAYRDPEVVPTIADLFAKAAQPDQIRVGLVLQNAPSDGIEANHPNVRVRHVEHTQARGPCWARARAYQLWDGESHVLQIDSHMRFAPAWDQRLLHELTLCPKPQAMITTYPPGYEPPMHFCTRASVFLGAKEFTPNGTFMQQGLIKQPPAVPLETAFIAAGFLFGPSQWIHDAPYDPALYFHGEEPTLAVRLWTSGWNFYGPREPIVWHQYGNITRPVHWSDDPNWGHWDIISLARVRKILGQFPEPHDPPVDLGIYRLGDVRTLDQYQHASGVNFRARTIAPHALDGQVLST